MKRKSFIIFFCFMPMIFSACSSNENDGTSFSELQSTGTNETTNSETAKTIHNATSPTAEIDLPSSKIKEDITPSLDNTSEVPSSNTAYGSLDSNVQPELQTPASDTSADLYHTIYTQTVMENTDDTLKFSLIFLDDDDIPELIVYNEYFSSYSIYTVKEDAIFCMVDSLTTVELTYFEQKSILSSFERWNGGGDEGGYGTSYYQATKDKTLTDNDSPILNDSYNAVYDDDGTYTGEGITIYYNMGQEIDEASYQEKLDSFGIVQGNGKLCSENALTKEDFISMLNQSRN